MKSKINVKQEQRIGKFVRDFSIVVQDERSVNYNILRNMLRELLNSQDQEEEKKLQVEMQDEYPVSHGDEEIKDRRKPHDFRPYYENEEFEDTPEETESDVQEWEEEWHSTPVYNQISFIKNLLGEREREVREEHEKYRLLWEEIHDMLKPFHLEGEMYTTTLKRVIDKLNNNK